jgi:hypothetical protein
MSYQDQRTDDHPEAVRSDPVPVPPADHDARPADDSEYDTSTHDAVVEDRGTFDDPQMVDSNHDGVADRTGVDDDVTERDMAGEPAPRDDVDRDLDEEGTVEDREASDTGVENATWTDADNDRDGDGVDDRFDNDPTGPVPGDTVSRTETVTDADRDTDRDDATLDTGRDADRVDDRVEYAALDTDRDTDRDDATLDTDRDADRDADRVDDRVEYAALDTDRGDDRGEDAALDDRGTFDDPVVASPVDVDENRTEERTLDGESPVFGEPALAPTALGATAAGGAAAAGAMAGAMAGRDDRDRVGDETVPVGAADTARADTTDMRPGDVPAAPVAALVSTDLAQGFRERWREVQLRFVDDPRAAAGEAQNLAEEAVEALISALSGRKSDLGGWEATEGSDTEQLRMVVRRYRDFLERVLAS